jgi:hypothetical protein
MWVLMRRPFRQLFLKVLGYYKFDPFGAETSSDLQMDARGYLRHSSKYTYFQLFEHV